MKIIPERDVYRLIMRSKLPPAERFELRLLDDAQRPCERLRVQRELVAIPTGGDREVDDLGRTFMVTPDGADLLDEDPVTGAFAGLFEPDWFQFAGLDDQRHSDGR